jgi:hypothetical protein
MQSKRVYLGVTVLRWLLPLGLIALGAGVALSTRSLEAYNRSPYPLPPTPRFNARVTLPALLVVKDGTAAYQGKLPEDPDAVIAPLLR